MTELYLSPALSGPATPSPISSLPEVESLIYERIWSALLDGRLPPGTKLPEEEIGDAFRVSRTVVRRVLVIMEQQRIVTLQHNRGAYVTVPGEAMVHDTLEVLRLIGGHALHRLSHTTDTAAHELIRRHQAAQQQADAANPGASRRLAVEFLILLAHLHGNDPLDAIQRSHAMLLGLALLAHQDATLIPAYHVDQQTILTALTAGDGDRAVTALDLYLSRIGDSLNFSGYSQNSSKLRSILGAEEDRIATARYGRVGHKSRVYCSNLS